MWWIATNSSILPRITEESRKFYASMIAAVKEITHWIIKSVSCASGFCGSSSTANVIGFGGRVDLGSYVRVNHYSYGVMRNKTLTQVFLQVFEHPRLDFAAGAVTLNISLPIFFVFSYALVFCLHAFIRNCRKPLNIPSWEACLLIIFFLSVIVVTVTAITWFKFYTIKHKPNLLFGWRLWSHITFICQISENPKFTWNQGATV